MGAGGYERDSTEIIELDQESPEWTEGPKLPRELYSLTLVETSQGTYAMGGEDEDFNDRKSSNWIAQETRSQAANGKKLEICNLQDIAMCLLHFQNLMISVECSASTTKQTLQKAFPFFFLVFCNFFSDNFFFFFCFVFFTIFCDFLRFCVIFV